MNRCPRHVVPYEFKCALSHERESDLGQIEQPSDGVETFPILNISGFCAFRYDFLRPSPVPVILYRDILQPAINGRIPPALLPARLPANRRIILASALVAA